MVALLEVFVDGTSAGYLDVPTTEGTPFTTYKYELESQQDLSAYTAAYSTTINLPKTHTNLVALDFPSSLSPNLGYGYDQHHYTYSLTDGSFTDVGKLVISSVTDTININLFSTSVDFNAVMSESYISTDASTAYKKIDGTSSSIYPTSLFRPNQSWFWNVTPYSGSNRRYLEVRPHNISTTTQGVFELGFADVGCPSGWDFDSTQYAKYTAQDDVHDTHTGSPCPILSAMPCIMRANSESEIVISDDLCHQLRWYQFRVLVPMMTIINNLVIPDSSYTFTISARVQALLNSLYYIGPTIADVASEYDASNPGNYRSFTAADVFSKLEKPWDIIRKLFKAHNIRVIVTNTGSVTYCLSNEYYLYASSVSPIDIVDKLDYTTFSESPHSYSNSHIIMQTSSVESASFKNYKELTGYEYTRGVYPTGYPVRSEKEWFKESVKSNLTRYQQVLKVRKHWDTNYNWSMVTFGDVEAYDSNYDEVDIAGSFAQVPSDSLYCWVLIDAGGISDPYKGYYTVNQETQHDIHQILRISPDVASTTLDKFRVPKIHGRTFMYGSPKYTIPYASYGEADMVNDYFKDVFDGFNSSTCTINVQWDRVFNSLTFNDVLRNMYWFNNAYWVVYKFNNFAPGSKDPVTTTFLRVGNLHNYAPFSTELTCDVSGTGFTTTSYVNGTAVVNPRSFTFISGSSVECRFDADSSHLIDTVSYTMDGWTRTIHVGGLESYTFYMAAPAYSISISVATLSRYIVTASASVGGSVSPSSQIVAAGGSAIITAVPSSGYLLDKWVDNGVDVPTTSLEYTITNISTDHNVVAQFRTDACQLMVIPWNLGTSQVGGGKVGYTDATHPSPVFREDYVLIDGHYGDDENIVQTANPGYTFMYWQSSDHSYLRGSSDLDYRLSANSDTIYAAFSDGTLYQWLVGSTVGSGSGTCEPMSGYAAAGQNVTVVAQEATGSTWGGWYDSAGTTRLSTSRSYTFQMPSTQYYTIRPKFELDEGVTLGTTLPPVGTIYYSIDSKTTWVPITQTETTLPTGSQVHFKYVNVVSGTDYTDFASWGGNKEGDTHNPTVSSLYMPTSKNISVHLNQRTLTFNEQTVGSVNYFLIGSSQYVPTSGSVSVSTMYAGKTYSLDYSCNALWVPGQHPWTGSDSKPWSYLMPKSDVSVTASPTYTPSAVQVNVSLYDGLAEAGAQLWYSTDGQQTWTPHAGIIEGQTYPGGTFSVAEGDTVYVKVVHEDDEGNSYVSTEGWTWGTSGQPTGQAIISNTVGSSGWYIGTCNATRFAVSARPDSSDHGTCRVTLSDGTTEVPSSATNYAGLPIKLFASPADGWSFERWSPGNYTDNPLSTRIAAVSESNSWVGYFVNRTELSEPTVSIPDALASITVKVNNQIVTSFPHQIYAGDSIEVTLVLNSYYAVESWTVNSSTEESEYPLTYTYTVPTPAVSITLFQANLYKYKEVGINVLNSAPSGAGATAYYTLSGTQHALTVGTESAPVINVVPISASSITVTATEVSSYVNESCVVAEDQSGTVVIEEVPMTNHVSVIPQSSILLYEDTFFIIPQYSAPTTKRISFASTDSTAPSGLVLKYQIGSGSVQTYSQPFYAPTNSSVTLYYERSTYADAYQWFSDGTHISGNDNQQSYSFTVTANVDITVSTKQVTIYFAENPDPSAFSGAILFSISGTDVTQYSGYEGDSVIVTARSGNAYFNGWTDGASNPRTIAIPHSSTTYLANYLEAYTVSAVTTTEGNRDAFDTLTMTIQVPGGSAVEYEPTTSHSNIPVGSTITVYWSLTDYYSASSWQGSSVPASSPSTFTMGNQALNLTLVVTKWYHLKANIGAIIGGSISNFLYSTNSGQSWSDAGIPSSTDYVSVPVGSWVKLQATVDSGYSFSEWQLDGSTLSGSQGLNQFTWNTSSNPPAGMDSMLTAVYFVGTSWNGLTFTSTGTTTLWLENVSNTPECKYSSDGVNWYDVETSEASATSFSGAIFIKGSNVSGFSTAQTSYSRFHFGGSYVAASGNVMSLIDGVGDTTTIPSVFCFYMLFDSCTLLTSMPTLTATNVTQACYRNMFSNCTTLTETSQFPAVAVDGANNCMRRMFYGCTSLSIVRVSNVTKTSTSTSTSSATYQWLGNVASVGTFYRMSTTSKWVANSTSGIPSGWTVEPA